MIHCELCSYQQGHTSEPECHAKARLPQSLQILVHGHLIHIIYILHLVIRWTEVTGEAVLAVGDVHGHSPVADKLLAVGRDSLQVWKGRDVIVCVQACLIFRLDQSIAIVHARRGFRGEVASVFRAQDVLPVIHHVVQARPAGHFRVQVRFVLRTDAGVDSHLVRRIGPEIRTET